MTAEPPNAARFTEDLLRDQQDLTAVARFSGWHDRHESPAHSPGKYRELIPLAAPKTGQQYAFEVDLDKCSGCKACVSACHSLNGLDDGEAWRNIGLLKSDDWRRPLQQTITTACHHCVEPGCLEGCPVLAYDKDPATGIVRHLDDQCIGCQYCVMKCPYDVPKYSETRGIVRKCDMCSNRLAVGEAPACVQACPNEAIKITIVDQPKVRGLFRGLPGLESGGNSKWLPSAPNPAITLPTTRYLSRRPIPEYLISADRQELRPEPAHWPLVFMLVITQLSVGMFGGALLFGFSGNPFVMRLQSSTALAIGLAGIAVGTLHLGSPMGAWRSFLGLRTSWLSREVVGFGAFAGLGVLTAAATWFRASVSSSLVPGLLSATFIVGLACVFCSVMVYADTRREFWSLRTTCGKFFGTTLVLGSLASLAVASLPGSASSAEIIALAVSAMVAGTIKLAFDQRIFRRLADDDFSPLHKTALLWAGRFGLASRLRVACTAAGAVAMPLAIIAQTSLPHSQTTSTATSLTGFTLCLAGELIERFLFFRTVQPVRMPGSVAS